MENDQADEYQHLKDDLMRQQRVNVLALNRLKVLSETGEEVLFSTFWKDKTVIIIFLRHFNCISCRAHADQIWNLHKELNKISTKIIFVGNGSPQVIKLFKKDLNIEDADVYTDPKLEVFKACGMDRSFTNYVSFKSLAELRKLRKQGYTSGSYPEGAGDSLQNGGVVGFRDPGKVIYHFTSRYLGDFDNPDEWPKDND
ncbi:AhpC/TSA family protein [Halobacteriovorax sp.]|uniref:AhpC/TSA family protein n=1 Tax=Halobacteriovorax sp. TaxID=2020862 RepID=UPI003567439B